MADMSVYDGIISPDGGLYKPSPDVLMLPPADEDEGGLTSRPVKTMVVDGSNWDNPFKPAEAAIASRDPVVKALTAAQHLAFRDGKGAGPQVLNVANQPKGSVIIGKDGSRLPDGTALALAGDDPVSAALAAIDAAAPRSVTWKGSKLGFTGSDPFSAYTKPYTAKARPAAMIDGGLFGIPISDGMTRRIAGKAGLSAIPGIGAMQNPTIAALAAVKAAAAPAPAPVAPTYTTTEFQQDRFQTTPGAQMPGSMNNERWKSGN